MECMTCPYAKDYMKEMLKYEEENSDNYDYAPWYFWCDKVGGKHNQFGWCSECYRPFKKEEVNKRSVVNKKIRQKNKKKKNIRTLNILKVHGYSPHIGYVRHGDDWNNWGLITEDMLKYGTHITHPAHSRKQKWMKQYSAGLIRRTKNVPSGMGYKKYFDYWWMMY